MNVFLERQFVKRWWLFMFMLAIIVIGIGSAYYATVNAEEDTALIVSLISFLVVLAIIIALFSLRMETRIDEKGVFTHFRPLWFTKKYFTWNEIREIYVRKYDATTEFGGWGIRGLGQEGNQSYNIGGNTGIQVVTNDDRKFLIGTLKPKEAEQVIQNYHTTHTGKSKV